MSDEPKPRPLRDTIAIRLRAARIEAVLVGLVMLGGILGIGFGMQAGLAAAIDNLSQAIGVVTGG